MRTSVFMLSCSVFTAALGAAQPSIADEATLFGVGIGATLGGLLGNQIGHGHGRGAATGLGIVAGGLIGGSIGQEIDRDNSSRSYTYAHTGFAPGTTYAPIVYYSYAPTYVAPPAPPPPPPVQYETYVDEDTGAYCRTYSQEIIVDGVPRESYGTACLQPDGSWRTVQ